MQTFADHNDGVKYILIVVEVLSGFYWVRPCLSKNAAEIKRHIGDIFSQGRIPDKIQTGEGSEFRNRKLVPWLNRLGINFFTTTDKVIKCAIAERLISKLRSWLYRFMYWRNPIRYVDELHKIVSSYNKSYHRTIGMAP